jgi:hypothetical protein
LCWRENKVLELTTWKIEEEMGSASANFRVFALSVER